LRQSLSSDFAIALLLLNSNRAAPSILGNAKRGSTPGEGVEDQVEFFGRCPHQRRYNTWRLLRRMANLSRLPKAIGVSHEYIASWAIGSIAKHKGKARQR
jgi:hypothetical protein